MPTNKDPKRVEIGHRLTAACEALGLSQVDIYRVLDVSQS